MNDTKNNVMTPSVKAKITWMNDDPQSAKKASASITIADSFVVNGLSVIESQKGLFVSMPQRTREKDGQKRYNELAHPITAEMRTAIVNAVFDSYSQAMAISQQYRSEMGGQPIPGAIEIDGDPSEIFGEEETSDSEELEEADEPVMTMSM